MSETGKAVGIAAALAVVTAVGLNACAPKHETSHSPTETSEQAERARAALSAIESSTTVTDTEPDETTTPTTLPAAGEFAGYTCTSDCSGHEAGYQWAEEHGIHDASTCGGNSQSFIEGCQAYAEGKGPDETAGDDGE